MSLAPTEKDTRTLRAKVARKLRDCEELTEDEERVADDLIRESDERDFHHDRID